MQSATTTAPTLTDEDVRACLRAVRDPYSGWDIVTLGWVATITTTPTELVVALAPTERIWTTRAAVEIEMERSLHACLATAHRALSVRWAP